MQITFLVGNGFDLSAGINTSYNGFYEWYISQPSKSAAIERFKREIDNYMKIEDPDLRKESCWADFEIALGEYTKEFTKDTADDFLNVYEDAHEGLGTYLEKECAKFDTNITDPATITNIRDGILNFYQELTPQEKGLFSQIFANDKGNNSQIKFISFNFTDSLDSIVKHLCKAPLSTWQHNGSRTLSVLPSVLHVHGTTQHLPIVGVFDESQVANKALLSYPGIAPVMIKLQSIQTIGELWYNEAEKQIDSSQIICIWGMSLGATDAFWWQKLVSWLRSDGTHQLIIFWYSARSISQRSILARVQMKNEVISRLTAYSGLNASEINLISDRIHVVVNTKSVLHVSFPLIVKEKNIESNSQDT